MLSISRGPLKRKIEVSLVDRKARYRGAGSQADGFACHWLFHHATSDRLDHTVIVWSTARYSFTGGFPVFVPLAMSTCHQKGDTYTKDTSPIEATGLRIKTRPTVNYNTTGSCCSAGMTTIDTSHQTKNSKRTRKMWPQPSLRTTLDNPSRDGTQMCVGRAKEGAH